MSAPILDQAIVFSGDKSALNSAWYFPYSKNAASIEYTVYITFDSNAAAGTVVLETAPPADSTDQGGPFTGTWSNIATFTFATNNTTKHTSVTGVFKHLRVRISSAITSGTVSGWAVAAAES